MNIQRKNSAHHFRMQSEREQTLGIYVVMVTVSNNEGRYVVIGIVDTGRCKKMW